MKKLLTVVLVFVLCACLSGCAEVTLTNSFHRNKVVQTIEICVTEDDASRFGYSREDILNTLVRIFEAYGRTATRDGNTAVGTITFDSTSDLAADVVGYGYTAQSAEQLKQAFFTEYTTVCRSKFSDADESELVEEIVETYFPTVAEFDAEAVKYVYNYETIYASVKSNGELSRNGDSYVHSWTIEDDTQMIFVQRREATSLWYLIAIGAALALVAVLIATTVIIKNRKNQGRE